MKTNTLLSTKFIALSALVIFAFTGCGVNSTIVGNLNSNQTVVELSEANYEIQGRYQGKSSARYFFGFGGLKEKDMHDEAMRDLLSKANLTGSQALVNITTERHYEFKFLVVYSNVIVSAHVVEFK